jgi:hypothetical protein
MTESQGYATLQQIFNCHAEFGRLDKDGVKKAMGPNWPPEWNRVHPDIFVREGHPR